MSYARTFISIVHPKTVVNTNKMSLPVELKFLYNIYYEKTSVHNSVFPLSGVIYFPKTNLPLNIFEQRYLNLLTILMVKTNLWAWFNHKRVVEKYIK